MGTDNGDATVQLEKRKGHNDKWVRKMRPNSVVVKRAKGQDD